jgi:ubiquinone/menaquinone biosynthesis C-methylase UbiE
MTTYERETIEEPRAAKAYKGPAMEGAVARWYARIRKPDQEHEQTVQQVLALLPPGSRILEVAPGPGYMAIDLARRGPYQVVGLDISKTFVEMASANAREAGLAVDFQQGSASAIPFADESFDFLLCRAAFKNFSEPARALSEMHRVIRPGGKAVVIDLRRDASRDEIRQHVEEMGLSALNALMTRLTFRYFLLKNAYAEPEMRALLARAGVDRYEIKLDSLGMQVWISK